MWSGELTAKSLLRQRLEILILASRARSVQSPLERTRIGSVPAMSCFRTLHRVEAFRAVSALDRARP